MPNLEHLLSFSAKEGVDIWSLTTCSLVRSIQVPIHGNCDGPVLLDNDHIVFCQHDRAILYTLNWKTGSVRTRSPIAENIRHLTVSHDGAYLAGGAPSGRVYVWQAATGELVRSFDAHYKAVTCVAFSDDDNFLFTGGDDGIVNCWLVADIVDAEMASKEPHKVVAFAEFSNHSLSVTSIRCGVDVSGGGKLVTSSLDRTVKIFNLAAKCVVQSITFPAPVTCVAMDPTETIVIAGCTDHVIYRYDLYAGDSSAPTAAGSAMAGPSGSSNIVAGNPDMRALRGHKSEVTGVTLSLSGALLASSSLDGTIKLWDVPNNQLIKTMAAGRSSFGGLRMIVDHYSALNLRGPVCPPAAFSKYVLETAPLTQPLDISLGAHLNNPNHSRGRFVTVGFPVATGLVTGGGLDLTSQESVLHGALTGLSGAGGMSAATLDRTHVASSIGAGMITDASLLSHGSALGSYHRIAVRQQVQNQESKHDAGDQTKQVDNASSKVSAEDVTPRAAVLKKKTLMKKDGVKKVKVSSTE